LTAITFFLVIGSGDQARGMVSWILGGMALSDLDQVAVLLPYSLVGMAVICLYARSLNVMQLDDEQAQQLGVNVERTKLVLLSAATLITAAAVSFAGTIGFVGIIVPHAVRIIWGPDHRSLLPLSALAGGLFLVCADTLVRGLGGLSGSLSEVPVGVITALVGAPFFLYLLRQKKRAVF
ncbi:MAG: iron chelate uptake ABC transporter family permease subunit, partial [Chloroflexi bacterium]|nr:iron chelate uptake ABC transporter family permease subunit [Chloroflexota bacterium]